MEMKTKNPELENVSQTHCKEAEKHFEKPQKKNAKLVNGEVRGPKLFSKNKNLKYG